MQIEKVEQPKLANHDSSILDLAFCMDCTGSMGAYIANARDSIRQIVEEIVASEKSDVRLALVEYRDHPPQESTFVTKVNDFTNSIKEMKNWLDHCAALGGGDLPEAVADGLHDVLKLSWREKSTKICVLISDAPPHGLISAKCLCDIDPIEVVKKLGEKGVTLYAVGCEPEITPYKDFFVAIAFKTGGQYVPLRNANLLAKVIIGGAQEEMSLEKLMEDVESEVRNQINLSGGVVKEEELYQNVYKKLSSKNAVVKNLQYNSCSLEPPSSQAQQYIKLNNMNEIQQAFKPVQQKESYMFAAPTPPPLPTATAHLLPTSIHGSMGYLTSTFMAPPPPPLPPAATAHTLHMSIPSSMRYPTSTFMAPPPPPSVAFPTMPTAEPTADSYSVAEGNIQMQQCQRLVQKALNRNNY